MAGAPHMAHLALACSFEARAFLFAAPSVDIAHSAEQYFANLPELINRLVFLRHFMQRLMQLLP
jgi:hypothetical protein